MASREHLKVPFFVTVAPKERPFEEKNERFPNYGAAESHYKNASQTNNVYAYLGEIGVFADKTGELKIDYMTFHTNNLDWWREKDTLDRLGHRGFGRSSTLEYTTNYQPLADLNWRL